jgi:hypothetical protein
MSFLDRALGLVTSILVFIYLRPYYLPNFLGQILSYLANWGRHGFDVGRETFGACRGADFLVNPAVL